MGFFYDLLEQGAIVKLLPNTMYIDIHLGIYIYDYSIETPG